ncbi:lipase 3-like [Phymastichus coffea]|uniref:lipase 3-like n=1 Tax=Phymastichus coffea TaxID=108790 RepID=UPI00273BE4CB|nr:lipase 3-like [Phymastichus coffea]
MTTEDGYVSAMHRITGSPLGPKAAGKPVVGTDGRSGARQLPLALADAGYDVWRGNLRGNSLSRPHREHSPGSGAFWNLSLDDMASKDLSKLIDFALEKSGGRKLTYVGYSVGATLSNVLLAEKPEYNEKMELLVSLGPSVYFLHYSTSFRSVKMRGLASVLSARVPTILSYSPAGTSYKTLERLSARIPQGSRPSTTTGAPPRGSGAPTTTTIGLPVRLSTACPNASVPVAILHAPNDSFVSDAR